MKHAVLLDIRCDLFHYIPPNPSGETGVPVSDM